MAASRSSILWRCLAAPSRPVEFCSGLMSMIVGINCSAANGFPAWGLHAPGIAAWGLAAMAVAAGAGQCAAAFGARHALRQLLAVLAAHVYLVLAVISHGALGWGSPSTIVCITAAAIMCWVVLSIEFDRAGLRQQGRRA